MGGLRRGAARPDAHLRRCRRGLPDRGVDIHYAVNITGHGWRKLMRAPAPFAYVIDRLPAPHPVFEFIQAHGDIDDAEAFGNFNMGAGFAIYVPAGDAETVLEWPRTSRSAPWWPATSKPRRPSAW